MMCREDQAAQRNRRETGRGNTHIVDATVSGETAKRAYSLAAKLADRDDWLATAMAHLYTPAWQPVLRTLGGVLGGRARGYVAALLRMNREDLCCRPLAAAIFAANAAGENFLPKPFFGGLSEIVIELYFDRTIWPPRSYSLALLTACGAQARPAFIARLSHQDRVVRARAALGLGRLRANQDVPELTALLDDEDRLVRQWGAMALGVIGTDTAIEPALQRAEHDELVAQGLGQGTLRCPTPSERGARVATILEGLGCRMVMLACRVRLHLGVDLPVRYLLELLDTSDWDSKVFAAEALGYSESSDVLPELVARSTHASALMRWSAAMALGRIGVAEGVAYLERLAQDEDYHVRTAANDALEWNRAGKKVPTVAGWLGYFGNPRLVRRIQSPSDAAEVAHQLGDSRPAVRQAALEAIAQSGAGEVVRWALNHLNDENLSYRWHAVLALGEVGDAEVVPNMLRLLDDESIHVRQVAALALGRIGVRLRLAIPVEQSPESIQVRAESLATSLDALAGSL
ncbi:MAG: HEAT repeat domain-containing protein [Planctomycetota bacterium]